MQDRDVSSCTCWCSPRIACPAATSLSLMTSKGLVVVLSGVCPGKISSPAASSRTMNNNYRPSAWDSNSTSESNRTMSAQRLVQSSSNSHLQYISTRGSSCMHVARRAWSEGQGKCTWRRHTSCPVKSSHACALHQRHTTCTRRTMLKLKPACTSHSSKIGMSAQTQFRTAEFGLVRYRVRVVSVAEKFVS